MADRWCSLNFKNGIRVVFLVTLCVLDIVFSVNCITIVEKGDSKVKREGGDRTTVDSYRKNEVKSFYPNNKSYPSTSAELQQSKDKGIKDRLTIYNSKDRDSSTAGTGYDEREKQYGLYAPEEQAYQGYGYQDFDQTPHYGPPQPSGFTGDRGTFLFTDGGYKDHREDFHGYGIHQYRPDPHAIALKGILIPLAGVALLGAAAALVTNPILLQLGVISGGKRRRRSLSDIAEIQSKNIDDKTMQETIIADILKNAKLYNSENDNIDGDGYDIFENLKTKHDNEDDDEWEAIFPRDDKSKFIEEDNVKNHRRRRRRRFKRNVNFENADATEYKKRTIRRNRDIRGKDTANFAPVTVNNIYDNNDVDHNVRFVESL